MGSAEVEERQLLKAMTWWDGFVIALANPGFLIAALGASIGVLGTTGAFVLWTISVLIGALQNNVYAEMATMFPQKAGGISLYAHEAWRKYLSFVGPIATFGYWFAWSSVLAINGFAIVGNALGHVLVVCLIAGLLLSMNTATMDGSRALYGISQDGMTTKWLGRLNSYNVPAIAMTMDVILNLWLISYFGYPLDILAAGNLGYILAHVFALGGFLLLRRDRPNWPRPIKLAPAWVPIAALLAAINLLFIVTGAFVYAGKYGYGWDKTWIGIGVLAVGLLLFIWRRVVEDREGVHLREETPTMPPES